LEKMSAALELGDTVCFAGAASQERVRGLYRRATVFVLPSVVAANGDRDGLANVLLEAMAAGVPVISTSASAAGEAVSDGVDGFIVAPHDPEALAERIGELLRNPQRRQTMGRAARERVCRDFDITRTIEPLVGLFGHG
jgi:glycosyltransferase involved in cell wall biosynthesis